jgi:non-canonical (house-cleaning) NTP pyrophosphatase
MVIMVTLARQWVSVGARRPLPFRVLEACGKHETCGRVGSQPAAHHHMSPQVGLHELTRTALDREQLFLISLEQHYIHAVHVALL